MDRLKYIVNVLIVALLLASVAIARDGRLLGESFEQSAAQEGEQPAVQVEELLPDGVRVINSTSLARKVIGYGGRTPIKLYIKDDMVLKVEALSNSETPSFFESASTLLDGWNGMSVEDVVEADVDVVSGATMSSLALIENVKRAAAYSLSAEPASQSPLKGMNLKTIVGLLVILSGVTLTLVKRKSALLESLQMVLNVAVLGFWCGSFLSLSQFVSWLSNGFNLSVALLSVVLLVVAVVLPLFGRKGSYCHMHCPMGSAQELMFKIPLTKIKIAPKVNKFLNKLRYYILIALLFMMWIGVGFDLMNYEVFSAFMISTASSVVLIMAAVFLLLSLFVKRPYCRFICPTGALLTMMQQPPSEE